MTLEEVRNRDRESLLREMAKIDTKRSTYGRFKLMEQAACRLEFPPSYAYRILQEPTDAVSLPASWGWKSPAKKGPGRVTRSTGNRRAGAPERT